MAAVHFLLFPAMAQGHLIPMADLAKLLAEHGAKVSLITTPQNTSRIHSLLSHSNIQILHLQFPSNQTGPIPQGCENLDSLPSNSLIPSLFAATSLLCRETEDLFQAAVAEAELHRVRYGLPWTIRVARKLDVPRLVFYSLSSLYLLAMEKLRAGGGVAEKIMAGSDSEVIDIPDLPDPVEVTKQQLMFTLDPVFWEG